MFKSLSTSLIVRGILAVVVGIIAVAWPCLLYTSDAADE